MFKVVLFLVLLFLALLAVRALRLFLAALVRGAGRPRSRPTRVEGEMVRDPICGVWIDRRLALEVGTGDHALVVCSEACRRAAEPLEKRAAP